VVAPGRGAHDCFEAASAHSGLRCLAALAGFSELNPQIACDVRQTAPAGPPMLMTGTLKILALPSAADGAAWAVPGPCGNRRWPMTVNVDQ
jgi:hypothetical protein